MKKGFKGIAVSK